MAELQEMQVKGIGGGGIEEIGKDEKVNFKEGVNRKERQKSCRYTKGIDRNQVKCQIGVGNGKKGRKLQTEKGSGDESSIREVHYSEEQLRSTLL